VDLLRQVEDLVRDVDQLFVPRVLFLHGLPLLVGNHLTLGERIVAPWSDRSLPSDFVSLARLSHDPMAQTAAW
jgi:hypothetical protein